jgi:hypothetical protein
MSARAMLWAKMSRKRRTAQELRWGKCQSAEWAGSIYVSAVASLMLRMAGE